MLIFALSVLLVVSCHPVIEPSDYNEDTVETATIELKPDIAIEEPAPPEPFPAPITEEPSQPDTDESEIVEPPTSLVDAVYFVNFCLQSVNFIFRCLITP